MKNIELLKKLFKILILIGFIILFTGVYFLIDVFIFALKRKIVKIPFVLLGILLVFIGNFIRSMGIKKLYKMNN